MPSKVTVGDRELTIQAFSGFKFLEAQGLVAHMLEIVPSLDENMADFAEKWRASNPPRELSRTTAELELREQVGWITDEAWEKSGGTVTITPRPDGVRTFLRLYPRLQKHARVDLEKLVALVVTPNSELAEADEAGKDLYDPDGPVGKQRKYLLHNGTITQLAQVAVAAAEALVDEFQAGDLTDAAGKLLENWRTLTGRQTSKDDSGSGSDERSSSTSSSERTRGRSRAKRSSTKSPTGS